MENNLFKKAFILMKDNLITIQPLFFCMLIMMTVLAPISSKTSIDLGFVFSIITGFFCFTAFLAGWYNCIKEMLSLKDKIYESEIERSKTQFGILKSFFPGVADYMLPISAIFLMYVFTTYLIMSLYKNISFKIFTVKNFPPDMLNIINTASQEEIGKYLQSNLTSEQLIIFIELLIGAFVVYFVFFTLVLWIAPVVLYESKNPFKAIWKALCFLFKNFGKSIQIVAFMMFINLLISFAGMFITGGFFAFIPLLLYFVYFLYYVITVFFYYESKTQNNSPDGAKFNRQI